MPHPLASGRIRAIIPPCLLPPCRRANACGPRWKAGPWTAWPRISARNPRCTPRCAAALDAHLEATDDPFRRFRNEINMPADGYVWIDRARARRQM
jgi:hypothetical protein